MKKMPCLFVREFAGNRIARITSDVAPGCEWVLAGEGTPYVKRDGTACAVIDGVLHRRYDAKRGRTPPPNAVPCDPEPDPITGHWPHWLPVTDARVDTWFRSAWARSPDEMSDGTYELCGPHFQGNPEHLTEDVFIKHDSEPVIAMSAPCFVSLRDFLECVSLEGLVFHHADGRMAKIRRADFGFAWPLREVQA